MAQGVGYISELTFNKEWIWNHLENSYSRMTNQ
jgi:hypothetical protein